MAFIPSQSTCALLLRPPLLLSPSVSIHLADASGLCALCYPKGWQFMASCLGLPPKLHLHLNVHLHQQQAACTRCVPQHKCELMGCSLTCAPFSWALSEGCEMVGVTSFCTAFCTLSVLRMMTFSFP